MDYYGSWGGISGSVKVGLCAGRAEAVGLLLLFRGGEVASIAVSKRGFYEILCTGECDLILS